MTPPCNWGHRFLLALASSEDNLSTSGKIKSKKKTTATKWTKNLQQWRCAWGATGWNNLSYLFVCFLTVYLFNTLWWFSSRHTFLLTKQNSNIWLFFLLLLYWFFFIGSLNLISTNPRCCVRRDAGMIPQVHFKSTNSVCSFGSHWQRSHF